MAYSYAAGGSKLYWMMRITWLQPWFHRRPATEVSSPRAALRPVAVNPLEVQRTNSTLIPTAAGPTHRPLPTTRVAVSLRNHVEVSLATQYLVHALACDDWFVACRHDHQVVVRLMREGTGRFAIAYDCSPPVEKAVCHGSRAWRMTVIPLSDEDNVSEEMVAELEAGLARLHA